MSLYHPLPAAAETTVPHSSTLLTPLADIVQVAAGFQHTCALTTTGIVKCWGWNDFGQLGDGTNISSGTPRIVNGLNQITAIASGQNHSCALTGEGDISCWGWNANGQLGDDTTTSKSIPVAVKGLGGPAIAIAAGAMHTCAIITGDTVECWGANSDGQIGNGSTTDILRPSFVLGVANHATAIAAGDYHTCAVMFLGKVKCWGANYNGQLGNGFYLQENWPVDVAGLSDEIVALATGQSHTCALTAQGGMTCWGWNWSGQLGIGETAGDTQSTPVDVIGLDSEITAISAQNNQTCALTTDGVAKCWGLNGFGQVGNGTTDIQYTPINVIGVRAAVQMIDVGDGHVCVVTMEARVQCWGWNSAGQLGDGTLEKRYRPLDVQGLDSSNVLFVKAGHDGHTCALIKDGSVQCWGWNGNGQLGLGNYEASAVPVPVNELNNNIIDLAVGDGHTCALSSSGVVQCWGRNDHGQVGDGTKTQRNSPVTVNGLAGDIIAVVAGDEHNCALSRLGSIQCWG
ncbi:MAG: hypothetical protein KDE46_26120, partial [Caldilineaceae bacterium]|nr:hypothetical protein [Caldilineaceae bacterium]